MAGVCEVGARIGPYDTGIDADFVRGYAAALGSSNPRYLNGSAVPPLAIAARIFPGQLAAMRELVPGWMSATATGGVHGEHDVVYHRPMEPGEPLATFVETHSVRPSKNNVRYATRHLTLDRSEAVVVEQLWTTILFGVTCEPVGPDGPELARSPRRPGPIPWPSGWRR